MEKGTKAYPPLAKKIDETKEHRFAEGDHVIVDRGTINEQCGIIDFFFGKTYCEIKTDHGDRLPVNIGRLSRN